MRKAFIEGAVAALGLFILAVVVWSADRWIAIIREMFS